MTNSTWIAAGLLVFIVGCAAHRKPLATLAVWPDSDTILLRHARLVDPGARTVRLVDLLIESGKIKSIAPVLESRGDLTTVDLTGAFYVLPGLIDLHVHAWGNPSPTNKGDQEISTEKLSRLLPHAGVTEFLDLGGPENERLKQRWATTNLREQAEMYAVGPVFIQAGRSWWPKKKRPGLVRGKSGARLVVSAADARIQVRELALKKPDFVKVIYDHTHGPGFGMSQRVMHAILDEARRNSLKTIVHIGTWQDARQAILAGASAITHLYDDEKIPADLPRLYAKHHVASIPTMAVQCDFARFIREPSVFRSDPLWSALTTPELQAEYGKQAGYSERARFWQEWQEMDCVSNDMVSLAMLAHAGVMILAGTDSGNLGVFAGFSIHRELKLMVEAGLDTWAALQSATTGARAFLGQSNPLAPGAWANLLILRANPVDSISATEAIELVLLHGKRLASTSF